eukprot:469609-Amphidinium_carterae.1
MALVSTSARLSTPAIVSTRMLDLTAAPPHHPCRGAATESMHTLTGKPHMPSSFTRALMPIPSELAFTTP